MELKKFPCIDANEICISVDADAQNYYHKNGLYANAYTQTSSHISASDLCRHSRFLYNESYL